MTVELFTNEGSTTVSAGGTTAPAQGTSETWTVASSASFPAAVTGVSQFHVADPALPAEIIAVTNVSGTTWTVTRGAESTTPAAHTAGFTVQNVITAGFLGALAQQLTRAAVQTGPYTAAANQIVPVDTTSGGVTVTLPNAPAAGTVNAVKMVTQGASNTVTIACAGSDVFNKAGGPTTGTLTLLNQGLLLQYNGAGIWTVLSDDLPLSQLDGRYLALAGGTMTGVIAMGSNKVTGLASGSASTDAANVGQTLGGGNSAPMTTLGDIIFENATPAPARLAGNTSAVKKFLTQTGTGTVSAAPAWGTIAAGDMPGGTTGAQGALQLDGTASDIQPTGAAAAAGATGKAADAGHVHAGIALLGTTGLSGYTKVNGTGTILSYTFPNDGAMHRTWLIVEEVVTVANETGGALQFAITDPGGGVRNRTVSAGGATIGFQSLGPFMYVVAPNITVTFSQNSALTAGTSIVYAELWGS